MHAQSALKVCTLWTRCTGIYCKVMTLREGYSSVGCVIIWHRIGACGSVITLSAKGKQIIYRNTD